MSGNPEQTVVIADYDYGDVDIERAIIEAAGLRLIAAQCTTEDQVIAAARNADAIIAQYATVGARAIDALTRCRVIARCGTGVDIVDVDAATRRGILVTNVPGDWRENEVADHAMALLLAVGRKICVYDRATRAGSWQWQDGYPVRRLRGSVLGLLSFGSIAQAIAARASGFGLRVIAHDPYHPADRIAAQGATPVSFDDLIEQSDYLVVQAPLTKETHHLIGEDEFLRMKPTAFLINTARGPIVSDEALYRALAEGWIAGAGLDDLEEEPATRAGWKPVNPLFTLPNAVITPHAAYYSQESIAAVRDFAAREVVRVLTGQQPVSPVNAVEGFTLRQG
jgi:D-3-phosphoglycerate dehydrogenase / 2-oxoglutarate reductase